MIFGLLPQHVALLENSAITHEVAQARGYVSVDTKATLARFGFGRSARRVPGLLIPIYNVMGKVAFHQYRPDAPRLNTDGKPIRYEIPQHVRMAIDVHPHARPWLADPQRPLYITEGIRKVDAAVSRGLCCVALRGVWSWRGRNEHGGKTALADWEHVALNGRRVVIVFDSDVMTKAQVSAALTRLRGFLASRGAHVLMVYLPAGPTGEKIGLDDYLAVGHTVEDLLALATTEVRTPAASPAAAPPAHHPSLATAPPAEAAGSPEPPETAGLLTDVMAHIAMYVMMIEPQRVACALWTMHTHAFEAAETTPYLHIFSVEKESGKTRLEETLSTVVRTPWLTGRTTVAALVRKVTTRITLLLDETDRAFKGSEEYTAALHAILNAGYRHGGAASVCIKRGDNYEVVDLPVFGPKAIASLGALPDTVVSRSIPIRLRRRTRDEPIARFRWRDALAAGADLKARLAAWAAAAVPRLRDARPDVPEVLGDRTTEAWEPLLAIADFAGGDWPRLAREAAVALHTDPEAQDDSLGARLLADIQRAFAARGVDRVSTVQMLETLCDDEEAPWGDWSPRGRLTPQALARLLRPFGVRPGTVRQGNETFKGYRRKSFEDAWARYLPPQSVTPSQLSQDGAFSRFPTRHTPPDVTDEKRLKPAPALHCYDVTDKTPPEMGEEDGETPLPPLAEAARRIFDATITSNRPMPALFPPDGRQAPGDAHDASPAPPSGAEEEVTAP